MLTCIHLKVKKALPTTSHSILCPVNYYCFVDWLSWRQNKGSGSSNYQSCLLSFISCLSDYSFFFLKLILKQTNRLVLLTSFFHDNWNNILDWYLIIPPQHSYENYEICYWFDIEWLQDWNCGTKKASAVFKEMPLHLRTCSYWNHSINK